MPGPVKTFKDLVQEAKTRVREVSQAEFQSKKNEPQTVILDVRETEDFQAGHIPGAIHLSRGLLELEIDDIVPDITTPIIVYCGGGSRSALASDTLQTMGYQNVMSLAQGYRGWKENQHSV